MKRSEAHEWKKADLEYCKENGWIEDYTMLSSYKNEDGDWVIEFDVQFKQLNYLNLKTISTKVRFNEIVDINQIGKMK